jgi:hypothetical protein
VARIFPAVFDDQGVEAGIDWNVNGDTFYTASAGGLLLLVRTSSDGHDRSAAMPSLRNVQNRLLTIDASAWKPLKIFGTRKSRSINGQKNKIQCGPHPDSTFLSYPSLIRHSNSDFSFRQIRASLAVTLDAVCYVRLRTRNCRKRHPKLQETAKFFLRRTMVGGLHDNHISRRQDEPISTIAYASTPLHKKK